MDTTTFFAEYPNLFEDFGLPTQKPKTEKFNPIIQGVHAMSSPNIMAMLNLAVGLLPPSEIYGEMGSLRGGSMVCALLDNKAKAVSVDNFSQFVEAVSEEIIRATYERFNITHRVDFHNQDCFEFLKNYQGAPFGVFYYDAIHSEEGTFDGLDLSVPHLADKALLMVDDYNFGSTQKGVKHFQKKYKKHIGRKLEYLSPKNGDPTWWNGYTVFEFIK